jgi:hypothetical protein
MQRRQAAKRLAWIVRLGGKCYQCQSTDRLEFDHIRCEEKSVGIERLWWRSDAFIEQELAKCWLLCFACHKLKTRFDLARLKSRHGLSFYRRHGCRCSVCRVAKAEAARRDRASRRGREGYNRRQREYMRRYRARLQGAA